MLINENEIFYIPPDNLLSETRILIPGKLYKIQSLLSNINYFEINAFGIFIRCNEWIINPDAPTVILLFLIGKQFKYFSYYDKFILIN